ncbi:MAG TPA: 50S ribosomal protein L9 [Blastocatellia bacterium]|nr:50S ribosomal protein L9 [Blastocatellia bacterium]
MAHMDVLLSEDVENLGHRGQVVRVRAGYGRNYLLPQGLATEATAGNKRMIEERQRILAKREQRERGAASDAAAKLDGLELRFERRAGEHGTLFGSVTAHDIGEALKAQGCTVERRRIGLREPIKELGDYEVTIKLHREVTPKIKVVVHREGAPEPETLESAAGPEAPPTDRTGAEDDPEMRASKGIEMLVQCMDALTYEDVKKLLEQSIRELTAVGERGSGALAQFIQDLLHSRSPEIGNALVAARQVAWTPDLLDAVKAVVSAPPLRKGGRGRFAPDIEGGGQVAWTDATRERLSSLAAETLRALEEDAGES